MEGVTGGQFNCQLASGLFTRFGRKVAGGDKSTGLFLELTLKELVFLCHEYYSIFLLQQEASAL
jgi:hypothetical protein